MPVSLRAPGLRIAEEHEMSELRLSTLLLRPATPSDLPAVAAMLRPTRVADGRLVLVLADVGADEEAIVRGAAVIAEEPATWCVLAAQVDRRWPPAGGALADQLLSAAAAAGVRRVAVDPALAPQLAAAYLGSSAASLGPGGIVIVQV